MVLAGRFMTSRAIFACLLDVVVPQVVGQLFSCSGTVFIFVLVFAGGLMGSMINCYLYGVLMVKPYRLPSDMLGNIDVDNGISLLDNPCEVVGFRVRLVELAHYHQLSHFSRRTTQVL